MYVAARTFAFRLYSPERYYHYGGQVTAIIWITTSLGLLAPKMKVHRATFRKFVAVTVIFMSWSFLGDGIEPRNGIKIDGRRDASLYQAIRSLPVSARIASHPADG